MNTIVLDTNVLIDHVHGFAHWLDPLLEDSEHNKLIVPTIVIAEYLTTQNAETTEGLKKSNEFLNTFLKQDLTEPIAQVLGILLRRKTYVPGASMGDLIIASTALYLDVPLATTNSRDFARIPHLRFFDPKRFTTAPRS